MKMASLFLASTILAVGAGGAMAAPDVVVSIKPIHSLVAAIMQGVSEPKLIVEGAASPHTYSLKPSNAKALEKADVVFWVGGRLEAFLEKPLDALAGKAKVVELDESPGLEKLAFREGGAFEAHDDEDDDHDHAKETHDHKHGADHASENKAHADHDDGQYDMHFWLDPLNAKVLAAEIEKTMIAADPQNSDKYQANGKALQAKLEALDKELAETVAPIKSKPAIVFHDAYQYFEHRYKVSIAGSITVSPETMPGADRISQIRKKVVDLGATCVFAEPQFEPKLVKVVIEGTPAKSATLDPEAATFDPGPELYFRMMRGIAKSMQDCLSQPG